MQFESVNKLFEKSIRDNWERPSLSNYKGMTLCYKDVARRIAKTHILFEACGLRKGDRVAVCSRNQANWCVAFLASLTYGAVPVPILHEFKAGTVQHLVNHSEAKVLYADDVVWEGLDMSGMPGVNVVIQVNNGHLLHVKDGDVNLVKEKLDAIYGERYPGGVRPEQLDYHVDTPDELAIINYTSGTSGFSKGVMIPYRALYSNIELSRYGEPHLNNRSNVVAMLPSAHMYGMMFEFIYEFLVGTHIQFLTRVPSPKIILQAMAEVKPDIIVAVPLVIEKVYRNTIKPVLEKKGIRFMLRIPGLDRVILKRIRNQVVNAFGGRFEEIIIGGAAFNKEVEEFFHKVKFPYTVGYGMTECAPIVCYEHWNKTKLFSCGRPAVNVELKIDSVDPYKVPGEILLKGPNVFLGYYKNDEATAASFTADGWFRTGDMGVVDRDGFVFLRGRNKCMILGPSGQNIYPEEIECVLNNLKYVVDTLVIEDEGSLTALVYPDFRTAEKDGVDAQALEKLLNGLIGEANAELPNYARIKNVEIMQEDFERTPKRSIKRYLYQRSGN